MFVDKIFRKLKDYYFSKYYKDGTTDRIKNAVFDEIRNEKVKMGIGKKLMYISSAAVLLIGILIGSAFASPTVANVLAQVPILNTLFEQETESEPYPSLVGTIADNLDEQGYKISGASLTVRDKTIGISIRGDENYYNEVKGEVEKEVKNVLNAKGLDAYNVEVKKEYVPEEIPEEQKKKNESYAKQSNQVENTILEAFEKQNYEIFSAHVRINDVEKFIPLEIPVSEKRVDEMKQIVRNIVKEKDMGDFKIKVYKTDPEKKKADKRWRPVISTISTGLLGIEELKVEGIGYSFYPSPLTLSIRTSIDSPDSDAKELGKRIESKVRQFIESGEVEENVQDDPYKINVYNKDEKIIN
ncbi:Protein of unknown function [Virgibacillus salinus]|uniref:DUF4030 domain-containing protein n=1 Tax=Virgibacillus salinus TaxID=553311 RepID=A0A1H1FPJ0_9BACI|nr:Protein of unknown function [Virgibacillus salinus]